MPGNARHSLYISGTRPLRPQADRQKTTIYNYGLPQDSRHFYKMPRDLPLRQSSGCMDGDISAVVAHASRRPPTSMRLVKVGNTIVALETPSISIQPRFVMIPSPVIRCLINDFGKIVGHLTLSPQRPTPSSQTYSR